MTDQMLKDAFERLADRAEPVDGLAERALRQAGRRRAGMVSSAVGAAAAVAAPFMLLGGGTSEAPRTLSMAREGLPANSPADLRVVRACMRGGSPTGPMGDVQPRLGKLADFRLLTSTKVGAETVAVVGSTRGYVLCALGKEGNTMPPWLHPWVSGANEKVWNFRGVIRIDGVDYLSRVGKNGRGSSTNGLHHLIFGRVRSDVARVFVTWDRDRDRKVEATVRNGFFLARIDSTMIKADPRKRTAKVTGGTGEVMEPRDERIRSVGAYPKDGPASYQLVVPPEGIQRFDPADCNTAEKVKSLALCGGLLPEPN